MIVLGDILHAVADFDDDAGGVGARDHVVLGRERVEGEGNADVPIVQGYGVHPDEDLVFSGFGDGFFEGFEVFERVALAGDANDGLLRHGHQG
jgi:hypothetical protein